MDELIVFWTARLDEAEATAKAAGDGSAAGYRWQEVDPRGQPGLIGTGNGDVVTFNRGTAACAVSPSPGQAACIAANDPQAVLADVAADRAILASLAEAREFSDEMFASGRPEGIADGEVIGLRMKAAAQVLTLERVVRIRAARFSGHPGYRPWWRPEAAG